MFRYTPKKEILKELQRQRNKGWNRTSNSTYEYDYARQLFKGNYGMVCLFMQYWENVVFFSEEQRREIPVNGVLFSVTLFDMEKV